MRSRILALSVAFASAIAAWLLIGLREAPMQNDLSANNAAAVVDVLTYAQPLVRGTVINNTAVVWREELAATLPVWAIRRDTRPDAAEALRGKLLRTDVPDGEAVRETDLIDASAGFLSLAIAPGMRAVAIRVTPEKVAGGFILPDDRVDVMHTVVRDLDGDGVQNGFSQTILSGVRVLAVGETPTRRTTSLTAEDQAARANAAQSEAVEGETVTLEVTFKQAELISAAAASGQLSLTLRAVEDQAAEPLSTLTTIEASAPVAPPVTASGDQGGIAIIEGNETRWIKLTTILASEEGAP